MGDKLGKVDRFHGMSAEAIAEAKKNAAKRKKRAKQHLPFRVRNERPDKQMKSMTYCTALFEDEMRLHRFLAVLAIALSVNIAVTNDARAS